MTGERRGSESLLLIDEVDKNLMHAIRKMKRIHKETQPIGMCVEDHCLMICKSLNWTCLRATRREEIQDRTVKGQEAVLIIEASTKRTPEEFSDAYGPSHIKQAHMFQKKEIRKGKADAQSTH